MARSRSSAVCTGLLVFLYPFLLLSFYLFISYFVLLVVDVVVVVVVRHIATKPSVLLSLPA